MTDRVAAIDCGTNSIRLLIAETGPDGGLHELDRRTEIVRLGQGVDATGELHPDALARTFAAVDGYAEAITTAGVGPERIRFVATSATRDVRNRDAFAAGIVRRLGVGPDVISGDTEARLSFRGALTGAPSDAEPVLVMDIGGGSTELIVGDREHGVHAAVSLDMGSVRVTERFWTADPPTADDLARATAFVDGLLDRSPVDLNPVRSWIGVAGTATTLAGVALGLPAYDRSLVHGARISRDQLTGLFDRLRVSTADQIRTLPSMHPGRADVITAGTLIATRVAARVDADALLVSESDILDGIALELLGR
ncbi:exopolyphosphatase/guanosine-5'-triphosphate,3'-diphosphate pyrophosphatase [Friedmanniella endophytica]|uniref:Exopolyphosphatase/guanosine-5'-triphosphate, 3'-diphosphate pyrophosphatase n=1 Tax=Microlunatus kandeliicorticis TaxID=1759536 RepID=A0A7W3ISS4_9ACTN|nr:Ppx/GppA phosphatase family protein [Microlunatus kandeliicorticis]MBA8794569.1 exopolyphosphatase/guanosine-5'-triphosphate,3'-diphosphate pyrophosphatase [Microlunatus kandeliicorticis]